MKGPCFQDQVKNFPWNEERLAALWKGLLEVRTRGMTLDEATSALAARLGLKKGIVADGLTRNPSGVSRKMTQEVWERQQAQRVSKNMVRQMISEMNTPGWQKAAGRLIGLPRRVAVGYHFTVFAKTHFSDLLFTNPITYAKTFGRNLALATKAGRLAHEQRLFRMVNDDDYGTIVRAGFDVQPGGGFEGSFKGARKEVLGVAKESASAMAFDELRIARYGIAKKVLDSLAPEERTIDNLKPIAEVVNNPTGSTSIRSKLGKQLAKFLFAPRLFPAQVRAAYVDPVRAITTFANRKTATPGELMASRMVARRMATLAAAYTGTLALEEGYSLATGDTKNRPNLLNVSKSDWLRPKLFGYGIPVSPTVELLKLPFQIAYDASNAPKGENKTLAGSERVLRYLIGRQTPAAGIAEEALTGQNPGSRRPTPFPGILGTTEETRTAPRMGYAEYLGTKMPIPLAGFVREVYDEMRDQGLSHPDAKTWIQSLAIGATSGVTGYHFGTTHETATDVAKEAVTYKPRGYMTPEERTQFDKVQRKEVARNKPKKIKLGISD